MQDLLAALLARVPSRPAGSTAHMENWGGAPAPSPTAQGAPLTGGAGTDTVIGAGSRFDPAGVSPQAIAALERLEQATGQTFNINSAYRDPAHNHAVGGANGSQHIHGNAFDVDVSGMDHAARAALIEQARAAGFGGIGVYNNALHFDVAGQRNWGPDHHARSTPDWALDALSAPVGTGTGSQAAPRTNSRSSTSAAGPSSQGPSTIHMEDWSGAKSEAESQRGGLLGRIWGGLTSGEGPSSEMRDAMVGTAISQSQASGSPLLALLAPIAGGIASRQGRRATEEATAQGLEELGAMDLDPKSQAALRILQNPNSPEWQRDLAETILDNALDPSAGSQRLSGQIVGPDGNMYGQDASGALVPYTLPDGTPVPDQSPDSQRLTGQITGPDGNLYGQDAQGNLQPYTSPDGQPIAAPEGSRGSITYRPATAEEAQEYGAESGQIGSNGRFYPTPGARGGTGTTYRDATAEEARAHGYASGQIGSNGSFRGTGRRLTAAERQAAERVPTPEPASLPAEPDASTLTPDEQAELDALLQTYGS